MNRNPLKRVLVVDDEPMIVSLLSTILREKGWDVTEARSGTEGIDQLDRGRFDVILTDLIMPGTPASTCCAPPRRSTPMSR